MLQNLVSSHYDKKKPSIQTEVLSENDDYLMISPAAAAFKHQLNEFKRNHNLLTNKATKAHRINSGVREINSRNNEKVKFMSTGTYGPTSAESHANVTHDDQSATQNSTMGIRSSIFASPNNR